MQSFGLDFGVFSLIGVCPTRDEEIQTALRDIEGRARCGMP